MKLKKIHKTVSSQIQPSELTELQKRYIRLFGEQELTPPEFNEKVIIPLDKLNTEVNAKFDKIFQMDQI